METELKMRSNNQTPNNQTSWCSQNAERIDDFYTPKISHVYSMQPMPLCKKIAYKNKIKYELPEVKKETVEEPIDLTCTAKRVANALASSSSEARFVQNSAANIGFGNNSATTDLNSREKNRRPILNNSQLQTPSESKILKKLDAQDSIYFSNCNNGTNRQTEVIKAAKSLFSKRTRTLFHWIYPHAPKAQLKAAVASSWETLGEQEKEFYISQVLGRFGFFQNNLMINPQLGGLSNMLPFPMPNTPQSVQEENEETSTAVTDLLLSEANGNQHGCMHSDVSTSGANSVLIRPFPFNFRMPKRKKRSGRPVGSKNKRKVGGNSSMSRQTRGEPTVDEFKDDPELCKEFQQFRWSLNISEIPS